MLSDKEKYYKDITAAAALLHDLGKFIRRTKIEKNKHWELSYKYIKKYFKGFECVSDEQIDLIAGIAALHHKAELNQTISKIKNKVRLEQLNEIKNILNNLKSKEDRTEYKIIEKIITGDLDSCSERKLFRDEDSEEAKKKLEIKNAQSEYSPLIYLFCTLNNIMSEYSNQIKYKNYVYFEPDSLNNFKNNPIQLGVFSKKIPEKIKNNLELFIKDIDYLKTFKKCTFEDCINSWDFLFKKYTSFICSSKWEYLKDISLYNHIQTTAATAVSVYKEEHLKNKCGEYLIIHGRIFDIQNYIYNGINSNIKKPMKRIFTRSFIISLINILIPNILIKKIELYTFNILFCGGGTFTILIPDEDIIKNRSREIMDDIKKEVGDLFNNKIYLEYEIQKVALKIDGDRTGYEKGFKIASMNLYEKKYNRTVENLVYDDSKGYAKCGDCGINYIKYDDESKLCSTCKLENDWIEASKDRGFRNFYIDYNNVNLDDIKYPNKFTKSEVKEGTPIICFSYDEADKIKDKYPIIDVYDIGKTYIKKTHDKCENCYGKDICDGPLKNKEEDNTQLVSLDCFSHMSENDTIIATAKIDVDDFQFLLYHVYPRKIMGEVYNFSISRLANTSSFFNLFFSMHLRRIIEEKYKDSVMVLYAGGDDIMITGNWEKVVDAVLCIKAEMRKIIGADKNEENDNITITAAILFHNSQRPFNLVVREVGSLLEDGKNIKNCVNLNGKILTFKELQEVSMVSNDLVNNKLRKNIINRSLLFKMKELMKMVSSGDDIEKMRAYAIYNYLINSEIENKKFYEDMEKNKKIKQEIKQMLESLICKNKSFYNKSNKYARERAIIEFAIRKSRERIKSNE